MKIIKNCIKWVWMLIWIVLPPIYCGNLSYQAIEQVAITSGILSVWWAIISFTILLIAILGFIGALLRVADKQNEME